MTCGNEGAVRQCPVPAFRSAWVLMLAALMWLPAATQAQTAGVLPREKLQALLDESNTALQGLITVRNKKLAPALGDKPDKRGRTLTQDIQQNVMLPETQARLEALQATAANDLRAGDLPAVQVGLTNLRRELTSQIERYQAIGAYWGQVAFRPPTERTRLTSTLRANGIEPAREKDVEMLNAVLDQQIASREFVTAMSSTWPRLQEIQKIAVMDDARQALAAIDSGGLKGLRSIDPTRKCVPAKDRSGWDAPTLNTEDFPRTSDYYDASKQSGKGGIVEVFVIVTAEGCAERALLVGPSQNAAIDEAGLKMAVDGRYLPGEKDGKAIRGGLVFRVDFTAPGGK